MSSSSLQLDEERRDRSDAVLVALEFSGTATAEQNSRLVPAHLLDRLLLIDPINEEFDRSARVPERAESIARRIADTGVKRVALTAACSACVLLAPVAAQLAAAGIEIDLILAVDPMPVSAAELLAELESIAQGWSVESPLDGSSAQREPLSFAAVVRAVDDVLAEVARVNELEEDERKVLFDGARERYLDWLGFVHAAVDFNWTGVPCAAYVLTVQGVLPLAGIFGDESLLEVRRFESDGKPGASNMLLGGEFRARLARVFERREQPASHSLDRT